MRSFILSSLAAASMALVGFQASASTVELTGFTYGPATEVSVGSPAFTGEAGQFSGTLDGASFTTFCVDLLQTTTFGTPYTDYSLVAGATAWGAQKSLDLDRAMSAFMSFDIGALPNAAAASAAVQSAIWEIIYETPGNSYDFSAGAFKATSLDAATQQFLDAIPFDALASVPVTYHVDQLHSDTNQDFLVLTPVPEPSTYALMLAGLAGVGFVARRRSQKR
jgi:hypothetical protein